MSFLIMERETKRGRERWRERKGEREREREKLIQKCTSKSLIFAIWSTYVNIFYYKNI